MHSRFRLGTIQIGFEYLNLIMDVLADDRDYKNINMKIGIINRIITNHILPIVTEVSIILCDERS